MRAKHVLRECEVFSGLSEADLEKVASSVLEKEYEAGATIFQGGDRADELLVLEEGKVAVQMTMPKAQVEISRRTTVYVVTKNEVLGWSAIVEPYVYTLTAICLQEVKALSISGNKLRRLLQDNHEIGYELLKGLIKVIVARLYETRYVLASERAFTPKPE